MSPGSRGRARRGGGAVLLALLMVIVTATDALALSWHTPVALTSGGHGWASPGSLAVSSSATAHAVVERQVLDSWHVLYFRTTNSGSAWASAVRLSRGGGAESGAPTIDAYSSGVNAAWVESDDLFAGLDAIVVTRRSTTSGASWEPQVQLSPTNESAGPVRIARYGSLVGVVWTNQLTGNIYLRRSTNGGATWSARQLIASTTNRPYGSPRTALKEGFPTLAIASGVMYVSYFFGSRSLRIRASTNSGSSFKTALSLATNAASWTPSSLAASGSTVIVGYSAETSSDNWTVIRRSTDKGAHWGSVVSLNPSSSYWSEAPVLAVRGTRWMAVYERCSSSTCAASYVYYRASTNSGSTWSTAQVASVRKTKWGSPADVDVATRTILLYDDYSSTANDVYVRLAW